MYTDQQFLVMVILIKVYLHFFPQMNINIYLLSCLLDTTNIGLSSALKSDTPCHRILIIMIIHIHATWRQHCTNIIKGFLKFYKKYLNNI